MTAIRHWLIRWLSFGDAIVMNVEIDREGRFRTREAGDVLVENARIVIGESYAVAIGELPSCRATLPLEILKSQSATLKDIFIAKAASPSTYTPTREA